MNLTKELVGASTAVLILKVLARGPSYGYEIVRKVNDAAEGVFTWQEGTIYPVLRKLEKEGLLRSQWEDTDAGRSRKYYHITKKGRKAAAASVAEWQGFYGLVTRFAEAHGV